jgi:hypothetical protein
VFVEARDENVQSKYIVQKVMELVDDGVALRDIAVLFAPDGIPTTLK